MRKIAEHMGMIRIISAILDVIILLYFTAYMYWIFAVLDKDNHSLSMLFVKVNPMTIGTYCMGISQTMIIEIYFKVMFNHFSTIFKAISI
ncbi:hypothetical protein [Peptostreptococcus canis]|uniref:RDD family protein n=1 Tax=Peptostreptococcus canis TaxID=1159213 RepID=A0ABR6TJG0_9FIRM|nr:hypothetical protein [Peptostreptococcus canis]MBC2575556.1 hypothetical protein [Peptostreptococcus canis]MBP1997247.1 hypothetical protein [Peptostreptococcus canis]